MRKPRVKSHICIFVRLSTFVISGIWGSVLFSPTFHLFFFSEIPGQNISLFYFSLFTFRIYDGHQYVLVHNLYLFSSRVSDGLRPMFQYSSLQYHMNHTCSTANTHQRISISLYHLFLLCFIFQSSSSAWIVESALYALFASLDSPLMIVGRSTFNCAGSSPGSSSASSCASYSS